LKIMAISGPVLSAMSILPAVSACTSRVPPVKALISRSRPCRLKMPARSPTSSRANVNAPATGLPKRTTSAEEMFASGSCASKPKRRIKRRIALAARRRWRGMVVSR